jgi:hypothetical protein
MSIWHTSSIWALKEDSFTRAMLILQYIAWVHLTVRGIMPQATRWEAAMAVAADFTAAVEYLTAVAAMAAAEGIRICCLYINQKVQAMALHLFLFDRISNTIYNHKIGAIRKY